MPSHHHRPTTGGRVSAGGSRRTPIAVLLLGFIALFALLWVHQMNATLFTSSGQQPASPVANVHVVGVPTPAPLLFSTESGDLFASNLTKEEAITTLAGLLDRGLYKESKHRHALVDELSHNDPGRSGRPVRNFGTNPSFQRVFDWMRSNAREAKAAKPVDDSTSFPVLGFLCTNLDFGFMLNHIIHIDNVVQRYVITVNGPSTPARIFLGAVQRLLPETVVVIFNGENAGVAQAWNNVLKEAFENMAAKNGTRVPFAAIANADVMPSPGQLSGFCADTRERHRTLVVNRFAHFAFFAVTSFGMERLGYFDEAMFPAYGEDVEYHLRAVSQQLGDESRFGKYGSNKKNENFFHYESVNIGHDDWSSKMFGKFNRVEYVRQKWGVDLRRAIDFQFAKPFKFPFSNHLIAHNFSWVVDPVHRACLLDENTTLCSFDIAATTTLIRKTLTLPLLPEGQQRVTAPPVPENQPPATPQPTSPEMGIIVNPKDIEEFIRQGLMEHPKHFRALEAYKRFRLRSGITKPLGQPFDPKNETEMIWKNIDEDAKRGAVRFHLRRAKMEELERAAERVAAGDKLERPAAEADGAVGAGAMKPRIVGRR